LVSASIAIHGWMCYYSARSYHAATDSFVYGGEVLVMDRSALLLKSKTFLVTTANGVNALCASVGTLTPRRRFFSLATAALLAAGAMPIQPLRADQTTRCTANGPNQTVCRIDEPIVTRPLTDYPQVTFRVGDRVTVSAGGCVQTGGWGATWKRYVNPSGSNSNRLYWGTISIPGATQGAIRLSDAIGASPLTVSAGISPPLILKLGYVDDDYSDNGYDSHDDGTENQCRNEPNAFVVLTIDHQPGAPIVSCAGSSGNSPLDLVWSDCDPNGFPLNPRWQYQVNNNGSVPPQPTDLCPSAKHPVQTPLGPDPNFYVIYFPPSCISWPVTYDSGFWCGPHVNFFAVTYQGPVDWIEKSPNGTDDDYNFAMFPKDNEGLVGKNPSKDGMEIEFDSEETVDNFSSTLSTLWTKFKQMVDDDNSAAQRYITKKMAVVTSLFGLDCGHPSCASEQHPAYAMAVDMDNSNLSDDQWAVFARNWGDEGFCSSNEHNLPVNDLKVLIPWLPGATAVAVLPDTQFYPFSNSGSSASVPYPQITVATDQGILLEFTLPDPSAQMGVEGELHLQWTISPAARSEIASRSGLRRVPAPGPRDDEAEKPENRIAALQSGLAAAQLQKFRTRLADRIARQPAVKQSKLPPRSVIFVSKLPPPPHLAKPVVPQSVPNPRLVQRNESLRQALCEAYNNNVPGYPLACQPNPRAH
jgi:hypothetical protein